MTAKVILFDAASLKERLSEDGLNAMRSLLNSDTDKVARAFSAAMDGIRGVSKETGGLTGGEMLHVASQLMVHTLSRFHENYTREKGAAPAEEFLRGILKGFAELEFEMLKVDRVARSTTVGNA